MIHCHIRGKPEDAALLRGKIDSRQYTGPEMVQLGEYLT
jgi:hypothetical protein